MGLPTQHRTSNAYLLSSPPQRIASAQPGRESNGGRIALVTEHRPPAFARLRRGEQAGGYNRVIRGPISSCIF